MRPRAVIADDEPHLAAYLEAQLGRLWPELEVRSRVGNGEQALAAIEREQPEVAFLDIRMPGLSGLEVAARIETACHVVFVTAYDEYAVTAFEREAADYLLKPVTEERLARTVDRLKERLVRRTAPANLSALLASLRAALPAGGEPLRWIRAGVGDTVRLIPVAEVCYFEAADKYTRVITVEGEALIRTPLKELLAQLDPTQFWQVHRGTLVNAARIRAARRDFRGRLVLTVAGCADGVAVSRAYAHLFRQM